MANTDSTALQKQHEALIQHPILGYCKLPRRGRLKWIGGNLALVCPVEEEVLDDLGNVLYMGLNEVLKRIDDFEGYRGNLPIKENLLSNCFTAHKHNLLTDDEKETFEKYVNENIATINITDAAQILMLNK